LQYILSETSIRIQCTSGVNYSIALGAGKNAYQLIADFVRHLTPMSEELVNNQGFTYYLYSNPDRTNLWGDGSKPDMHVLSKIAADGSVQSIPVYARGYAMDELRPGTYADTVT
ncbi:spore coat U domain-containing protein, partial [Escherichia coli]|uniref:spore coat U domain-containing protein n=1 Tax=Escherichia coli TaxID=562 RepID=UPI0022847D03